MLPRGTAFPFDLDGKRFTPLGRGGPKRAKKLVKRGVKQFRKERDGKST